MDEGGRRAGRGNGARGTADGPRRRRGRTLSTEQAFPAQRRFPQPGPAWIRPKGAEAGPCSLRAKVIRPSLESAANTTSEKNSGMDRIRRRMASAGAVEPSAAVAVAGGRSAGRSCEGDSGPAQSRDDGAEPAGRKLHHSSGRDRRVSKTALRRGMVSRRVVQFHGAVRTDALLVANQLVSLLPPSRTKLHHSAGHDLQRAVAHVRPLQRGASPRSARAAGIARSCPLAWWNSPGPGRPHRHPR